MKQRRSKAVPITIAALLGTGMLTGCGSSNNAYDRVCVDQNNTRQQDANCNNGNGTNHWYYIPHGGGYITPGVGSRVNAGSAFAPSKDATIKSVPESGATGKANTTVRGGFGGKSGTVGG